MATNLRLDISGGYFLNPPQMRPICQSCGIKPCEPFGGSRKGFRKKCWRCRYDSFDHSRLKAKRSIARAETKIAVIALYGGKCQCCSESNISFLTIDHVNRDGAKERKLGPNGGFNFYRRLLKMGRQDKYQILCFNCNLGRELNGGICPHKNP
jgi:hypothetical protein